MLRVFNLWLLLGYYSLCSPFKPVVNASGHYEFKTNKIQKCLCLALMWPLLCVLILISRFHYLKSVVTVEVLKSQNYFDIAEELSKLSWTLFFLTIHSSRNRDVLQKLLNSRIYSVKARKANKKSTIAYVVLMHTALSVTYFTGYVLGDTFGVARVPVSERFNKAVTDGTKRFFMAYAANNRTQPYTGNEIALGLFELILLPLYRSVYLVHITVFLGAIPLTTWTVAKNLEASFKNAGKDKKQIIENYHELKDICASINSIWSLPIFFFTMGNLINVMWLDAFANKGSLIFMIEYFMEKMFLLVALILMAESCRTVARFKLWIVRRDVRMNVLTNKLERERLLQELERGYIGIGRTGLYLINYGFLSQFAILLITLFTVSFQ